MRCIAISLAQRCRAAGGRVLVAVALYSPSRKIDEDVLDFELLDQPERSCAATGIIVRRRHTPLLRDVCQAFHSSSSGVLSSMGSSAAIGIVAFCVAAICAAALLSRVLGMLLPKPRAKKRVAGINIDFPRAGDAVQSKITVKGTVQPSRSPVQILVYPGDGSWYPQGKTVRKGASWSAACSFGLSTTRPGHPMKVIAISGTRLITKPVETLPAPSRRLRQSAIVDVVHAPPAAAADVVAAPAPTQLAAAK